MAGGGGRRQWQEAVAGGGGRSVYPGLKKLPPVGTTRPKIMSCNRLLKTGLNNVALPTLFNFVNNIVQHCYT